MRSVLLAILIFGLTTIAYAELKVLDSPMWIFPGQIVRICLQQPAGSGPLAVKSTAALQLFDQWDQDSIQRFYFRSTSTGPAPLTFTSAGGTLTLNLEVTPWADVYTLRQYKQIALPRIWPVGVAQYDELKTLRTLYTDDEIKALKGAKIGDLASKWLALTDEQVFNIIPGPSVPRTCLMTLGFEGLGKGCPVCGMNIYEGRSGFYPWLLDPDKHPWKVGCPSCNNWFPSNDFANGDMHSGDFPDDGFGCEPKKPILDNNGKPWRFPFIAYYHEWQPYMKELTPGYLECAQAYAATGDKRYAHKCAIALFRFAESMLDMSLNLNHRKMAVRDTILRGPVGASTIPGLSGSFLYIQPNWDTPRMENAARAWDLVFDQLDGDADLLRFCQANNHPEIKTIADFRRFIDAGVLRVPMQACLDNAVARNYPMQETTLATMALCLGTPDTMKVVDWLLNDSGIRFALTNNFFQDGSAYESESYNSIGIRDTSRLLHLLERIRDIQPDLYKAPRFVSLLQDPRYRRIYDFCLESSLIGRTSPTCGDTGACAPASPLRQTQGIPCGSNDFLEAYRATKDPHFLQALYGPDGSLLPNIADQKIRAEAEKAGKDLGWQVQVPSNILDGYGFAILRSGTGDNQRALWLRYHQCLQHAHPDMLTFGFEAMQRKLLPELGYPQGWNYAGHWESNWGTHYGTKIVGASSSSFNRGELLRFANVAPVQLAEAQSSQRTGDQTLTRRRLVALVDISDTNCYAISLERVAGGTEQYWSFHGPDGEATAEGLKLQAYEGTALGPGLKYGDLNAPADKELTCLSFMRSPQSAFASGPWSLDYLLRDQKDVHLRLTTLSPTAGEVTLAKGQAPNGRSSYDLTFAIQHQKSDTRLNSQYLNILEPYKGQRLISTIEPLPVTGAPADAPYQPLAFRVIGTDFVDTVIIQSEPGQTVQAAGLTTDGVFALWRESKGKLSLATLVGGTHLTGAGATLTLPAAAYQGTITACDWSHSTITVKPALPNATELVGRHIRLTNPAGSAAAYQIKSAQNLADSTQITFALDPRLGEGFVASCADGLITTNTSLVKARYGYYCGKWLSNEDGSTAYRLKDVAGRTCLVDEQQGAPVTAATLQRDFVDKDGDGLVRFLIYDYGVGDTVTMENSIVLHRN